MNTYDTALYPSDAGQNAVKVRPANASTSGVVRVSIASYGAVDIRIMQDKRSGDVYLATNEKMTTARVPYTGHTATDEELDDVETFSRIQAFEKNFEGLDEEGRAAKRQEMRTSGKLRSWEEVKAKQRAKRGL